MLSVGKEQKIQLKEFDVAKMHQNASIAIIGKNECPKSVLEHYKNIQTCHVVAHDTLDEQIYTNIFPNVIMHNYNDMNIFCDVLQEKVINNSRQIIVILDYRKCNDDDIQKCLHDTCMRTILFNCRHLNITYIIMIPILTPIMPTIRDSFNYVFIGDTDIIHEQKKLYECYAGMFPTFDNFMEVYTQIMKHKSLMVLNYFNNSITQEICDKVFYL